MRSVQPWFQAKLAATGFRLRFPHFGPQLALMDAVADDTCLMAVSPGEQRRVRLHVNTGYFDDHPAEFVTILQHEVHHVLLGHLDDRHRTVPERVIMQVAKEISANEDIVGPLPGNPHLWTDYAQFGIRPKQSTDERYRLLVKARDEGRYQPPPTLVVRCCECHGDDEHDGPALTLPEEVREHLRRAGRDAEPAELPVGSEVAPVIRWPAQLRRMGRSLVERRPTARRANRRDPERLRLGELPGQLTRPVRPRLLAAIDTSGSMRPHVFARIAGELRSLSHHADLVVVECDKLIRRSYPYAGRLQSVQGRGGTDLRPVFARDFLRRHRADGVVYFTDGDGSYPVDRPCVPTVWVLTAARPFECPWGCRVRLDAVGSGPGESAADVRATG